MVFTGFIFMSAPPAAAATLPIADAAIAKTATTPDRTKASGMLAQASLA